MGPRSYNLQGNDGRDWQRSDITTDNGWGSAGQWDGSYFGPYEFAPLPVGTPTRAPLYVHNLGPCGENAPPGIVIPDVTPFPFQQNPCTFPNWITPSTEAQIEEFEEAAADMFLNWVYRKNYGASIAFRNQLWRSSNCYFAGCPDQNSAGTARFNWMESTMSALFTEFSW
jgi:hypothetical protein